MRSVRGTQSIGASGDCSWAEDASRWQRLPSETLLAVDAGLKQRDRRATHVNATTSTALVTGKSGTTATSRDVSDEDAESNDSYRRFVIAGASACVITGAWLDLENNAILEDARRSNAQRYGKNIIASGID